LLTDFLFDILYKDCFDSNTLRTTYLTVHIRDGIFMKAQLNKDEMSLYHNGF